MPQRTRSYPSVVIEYTVPGALAAGASVDVNLARTAFSSAAQAGIPVHLQNSLKGTIEGVTCQLDQAQEVPITIKFWANDTFDHFTTGKFLGDENVGESDFSPIGVQLQTAYLEGTNVDYEDEDGTGELHFQVFNDDGANAIGAGDLKVGFIWRPHFPG